MINALDNQQYDEEDSWSSSSTRQQQSQPKYYSSLILLHNQHNWQSMVWWRKYLSLIVLHSQRNGWSTCNGWSMQQMISGIMKQTPGPLAPPDRSNPNRNITQSTQWMINTMDSQQNNEEDFWSTSSIRQQQSQPKYYRSLKLLHSQRNG
jgi:hypothetical protein